MRYPKPEKKPEYMTEAERLSTDFWIRNGIEHGDKAVFCMLCRQWCLLVNLEEHPCDGCEYHLARPDDEFLGPCATSDEVWPDS